MNEKDVFYQKLFALLAEKFCVKDSWKITYSPRDLEGDVAARCSKSWEYNSFHIDISSKLYYEESYEVCIEYILHEFCHGINGGIEGCIPTDNGYTRAERMVLEKTTKHWEKIMLQLLDKDLSSLLKAHRKSLKEKK